MRLGGTGLSCFLLLLLCEARNGLLVRIVNLFLKCLIPCERIVLSINIAHSSERAIITTVRVVATIASVSPVLVESLDRVHLILLVLDSLDATFVVTGVPATVNFGRHEVLLLKFN